MSWFYHFLYKLPHKNLNLHGHSVCHLSAPNRFLQLLIFQTVLTGNWRSPKTLCSYFNIKIMIQRKEWFQAKQFLFNFYPISWFLQGRWCTYQIVVDKLYKKPKGILKGKQKKMDILKINQFNKPSALRQKSITIRLCFLSFFVLLISVWIWIHSNPAGKAIPSGISRLSRNIWIKSIKNSSRTHISDGFQLRFAQCSI